MLIHSNWINGIVAKRYQLREALVWAPDLPSLQLSPPPAPPAAAETAGHPTPNEGGPTPSTGGEAGHPTPSEGGGARRPSSTLQAAGRAAATATAATAAATTTTKRTPYL